MAENIGVKVTANTKGVAQSLSNIANSLRGIKSSTDKNVASMGKWFNATQKLNNKFTNLNKDINRSANGLNSMNDSMKRLVSTAGALMIGAKLGEFVNSALESIETANLFNVALGEMSDKAMETVNTLSELYGLDSTNIQNAVGSYALLAKSMGMTSEQAEILATNTYRMGLDLSSLMNVPINQVMADLRSGLVGQSETVYKYGMDVTEAGLKQEALNQGIEGSVRNMSQGEKMALRYAVMIRTMTSEMGNSTIISGDFARTLSSPANQLKILSEGFVTLGRSIGNIFLPMLSVVLPYLNALVRMLITVANAIASFFGYTVDMSKGFSNINNATSGGTSGLGSIADDADNASKSIGGTNKGLDKTKKKLKEIKDATLGLDELNVMPKNESSDTSSGSGGGGADGIGGFGAGGLGGFELPTLGELDKNLKTKSSEILGEMQSFLDNLYTMFQNKDWTGIGMLIASGVNSAVDYLNSSPIYDKIVSWSEAVGDAFGEVFNVAVANISWENIGSLFAQGINTIATSILNFVEDINFVAVGQAFAKALNSAITQIDWVTLGQLFTLKFRILLDEAYGFVNTFDFVNLGLAISKFVNSAFASVDWNKLGTTIDKSFDGVLSTLETTVKKIDWKTIGTSIASGVSKIDFVGIANRIATDLFKFINGAFALVNWTELGSSLGTNIIGLLDAINTFLSGLDWSLVGQSIVNFISGIDWAGIVASLANVVGSALSGLVDLLIQFIQTDAGAALTLFVGAWKVTELLGFVQMSGGVVAALSSITGALAASTTAKIIDKAETMYITALYAKDFVAGLISSSAKMLTQIGQWAILTGAKIADEAAMIAVTAATTIWNGVCAIATGVTAGLSAAMAFLAANPIVLVIAAVAALIAGIVLLVKNWDKVKETAQIVWDKVVEIWSVVSAWFNDNIIVPVGNFFKQLCTDIGTFFSNAWNAIVTVWNAVVKWFTDKIITPVASLFKKIGEDIYGFFKTCWDGITKVWSAVSKWFSDNIISPVTKVFKKIGTDISGFFDTAWTTISSAWKNVKDWFSTNVCTPISNVFRGMGNGIVGFFEGMINGIIRGVNKVIGFVNGMAEEINKAGDLIGMDLNIGLSSISEIKLPRLATGGSLDAGQFFEAGEGGKAELLGSYQGKTTVMPLENSGFVEAMYEAVYNAVSSAQQGSGGSVIENVVNLDGEVLYRNQQKVASTKGVEFGMGVFAR